MTERPERSLDGLSVGDRVKPSAALRAWGRSAIDHGGVITRLGKQCIWVRPLKSTRVGFHWLWSRHKEYMLGPGDVEVVPNPA